MNPTHLGPDKQAKMVLLKFRFRGDIREISDSAPTNTARSFTGINFVFAGLSLPWKRMLNFFLNICDLFQQRPTFLLDF